MGNSIISRLARQEHAVYGVYHKTPTMRELWPSFIADLTKTEDWDGLSKQKYDTLVHCAAAIPASHENANKVATVNSTIDQNVFKFCQENNVRLIYFSSCSVYGLNHTEPKEESSAVTPVGAYAEEKYQSERTILLSKLPNPVILRVSSPYGIGQKHNTVLKLFLSKALNQEDLLYHGTGLREQSFVHMEDIAKAVDLVVNKTGVSGIFNAAGERSVTMKELAEITVKATGSKSQIKPSGLPDSQEGFKVMIDIGKAKRILNWQPGISLEQGIAQWADCLRAQL